MRYNQRIYAAVTLCWLCLMGAGCSNEPPTQLLNGTWMLDYASIVNTDDKETSGQTTAAILGQVYLSFDTQNMMLQWNGGGQHEEAPFTLDEEKDGSLRIHSRQKGGGEFTLHFDGNDAFLLTMQQDERKVRFKRVTTEMMQQMMLNMMEEGEKEDAAQN